MPYTSRFAEEEESRTKLQDQEHSLLSELLPETDLRLAGLRMSLQFPPIQPEKDMVAEVEDSEQTSFSLNSEGWD